MLNVLLQFRCRAVDNEVAPGNPQEQTGSKSKVQSGNVTRNLIVTALTLLCVAAGLAN